MYEVRKLRKEDYKEIQKFDFFQSQNLQWNRAGHKEDQFVAVDEEGKVVGCAGLFWDGTWYYLNPETKISARMEGAPEPEIPLYRMQYEIAVEEALDDSDKITDILVHRLQEQFQKYQQRYPDKELRMRCWCYEDEKEEMQQLLTCGFEAAGITLVLSYDLTQELPQDVLQDLSQRTSEVVSQAASSQVEIKQLDCNDDSLRRYLKANAAGYDDVQDSEDELRFRLNAPDTHIYTALVNGQIAASCTVWKITEERYATENVFTVPDYRRQGLGSATLFTALQELKEGGVKEATLTVLGSNHAAIAMYLSMGYQLKQVMYEMHYDPRHV